MTRKLNICLVGHEFPPNVISGPGRYAMNLVRHFLAAGHKVTFITPSVMGGAPYEKKGRLEVRRLDIRRAGPAERIIPNVLDTRIMFSLRLRRFFRRFDAGAFDVLHILDAKDSYFLSDGLAERLPVIISINDYYSLASSWNPLKLTYFSLDFPLRYLYYNVTRVLDSRYMKKASCVIANSAFTARAAEMASGVPRKKIRVFYKGVDTRMSGGGRPAKRRGHGILFVGSNMERKGAKYLLLALPAVAREYPDATLTIVGRCSLLYRALLRRIIRKRGLGNMVTMLERVPPPDMPSYYEKAGVFVLPSLEEAFGQTIMEAMLSGTPVVASAVGGIPELVSDGTTGLLVRPRDPDAIASAVSRIFADEGLARRMGEEARRRVIRNFSSDGMAERTMELYFEQAGK